MVHQQSGPFPMLTTMGNRCPSEISIHFPNRKESAHPAPFFELKNVCPSINNTSVLPPNLGVISSFSIRKSSPWAPAWVHKLFHLEQRLYQNVCLFAHLWRYIFENHFSFLDFITENVMLDLNVLQSFWNTSFLWGLHIALDHYNISWLDSTLFVSC